MDVPAGHTEVRRNLYPPAACAEYASKAYCVNMFSDCPITFRNQGTYCSSLAEKINEVPSLAIICTETQQNIHYIHT